MKQSILRMVSCAWLICAAVMSGNAANGIIETKHYTQCPSDTVWLDISQTPIVRDTVIRDTIAESDPFEDSIYVYVVNFYPSYRFTESRELEVGQSFEWRGMTISSPGRYDKVYKSRFGCDSTFVLNVTPRFSALAVTIAKDTTICDGSYIDWRDKQYSTAGTYVDSVPSTSPDVRDTLYVLYLHVASIFHKTEMVEFASFPASYRGISFDEPGKKEIKYISYFGCDSIYTVIANRKHVEVDEYETICSGDGYTWPATGETYTESGIYQKIEKSADGLRDSITRNLHLTVHYIPVTYLNATICDGDSYSLNGKQYTEAGTHRDTFLVDGCDSIVVLSLNIAGADTAITVKHIEAGDSYDWHGQTCTAAGTYDYRYTNNLGCQAVDRLILTTHQVDVIDTTATICPGDSIQWHGITGYSTKTYSRQEILPNGNEILYRLHLTVKTIKTIEQAFTICAGEEVVFQGQHYTEPGTYSYQYTCDTLYNVVIKRKPANIFITNATFDGKSAYTWHFTHGGTPETKEYSKEGTYEFLYDNASGCKDTYRLVLRVDSSTYQFDEALAICEGEDFVWHNMHGLSHQGIGKTTDYYANYKTKAGKDSIYHLALTVHPVYALTEKVEFLSFPVDYRHRHIEHPGTYVDSLKTVHGCDSIITFEVQQQTIVDEVRASFCAGSYYTWRGKNISQAGQYFETEKTYDGLRDSVYHRLILSMLPTKETQQSETICNGGSIVFGGQTLTKTGVYRDTLVAENGCDSVVVLTLNVVESHLTTLVVRRDSGESYTWDVTGDTYITPYIKDTTLTNRFGCDSTVRLMLTANYVQTIDTTATICNGDFIEWHGERYYEAGTYTNVETLPNGDKVYFRMTLVVKGVTKVEKPISFSICAGETIQFYDSLYTRGGIYHYPYSCDTTYVVTVNMLPAQVYITNATFDGREPYSWRYILNGAEKDTLLTQSGTYEHKEQNATTGCNDIYRLYLTVDSTEYHYEEKASICEGESYTWHNKELTNLGVGTHHVYDNYTTATGRDSSYHLTLTVHPVYRKTEVVEFGAFPSYYRGWKFDEPGSKEFIYTSSHGCDSIINVVANRRTIIDEERVTICAGDYYDWRNKRYTDAGQYQEVEMAADGVTDSIYHRLVLTVKNYPDTYINATICRGSGYTFAGVTYTEEGVYRHTFQQFGCDSTVILSLNVVDVDTVLQVHRVEEGQTYTWDVTGRTYPAPGTYDTLMTNRFGCDSIVRLMLVTHRVDTVDTTATICPGTTLAWHGILGRETHVYTNVEEQADGSHTVYRLDLKVLQQVEIEQHLTICSGESASYKNSPAYSAPGSYGYQYTCDTLYRIIVTQNASEVHVTNATFSGKEPYTWRYMQDGQWEEEPVEEPGTYEHYNYNSETGCNDIYRLILTVDKTSYHFVEEATICEGEAYTWRGHTDTEYSRMGIGTTTSYFDNYKTAAGQDSIYELKLTVLPAVRTSRTITFCGETTYNGVTYTSSTVVYDTISSVLTGCDSIVRIHLDQASNYLWHDTATIVQGEILDWHGIQISTNGLYRDVYKSVYGCDSIYEIGVGLIAATPQSNTFTTVASICEGDYYEWRGGIYAAAGTYTDSVPPQIGIPHSDTIFVLQLKVWPSYRDTIVEHMYTCGDNAVIRYNGQDYNTDTTVVTTFRTIHNCDSIVMVHMHFNTATFHVDTVKITDKQLPYHWTANNDTAIYNAGTYYMQTPAEGGCYNRRELVLIVYPTFLFTKDTTVCEMDLPYYWLDGPQDKTHIAHNEEKMYEYSYQTVNGTDSIYRLNLHIDSVPKRTEIHYLCENEDLYLYQTHYGGSQLSTIGVYRDTVTLPSTTDNVCDSVIFLEIYQYPVHEHKEVVILPKDSTIEWEEYTITEGGTYTHITEGAGPGGCDSISRLVVVKEMRDEATICVHDAPYIWRTDSFYTSGLWTDTVCDADGFIKEFHSLDLTINIPVDTTIYLRGCKIADDPLTGVTWNDVTYSKDTTFRDTLDCDRTYTVHIRVDTTYLIERNDTICEQELPYILGRQNPDTIRTEGWYTHTDTTACGCDSTVNVRLYILPALTRNDSVIICEDQIEDHPVILGTHQQAYYKDTILYDCDHTFEYHIIVRPKPEYKDTTYYLCEGDSVQLFWPKETWVKEQGIYNDTVLTKSPWKDEAHGYTYDPQEYLCDSVTRWKVLFVHPEIKDTTAHIRYGDSIWWAGLWRYEGGDYDSIGPAKEFNSDSIPCRLTYTLHLCVDSTYYFRDTTTFCATPNKTITHIWADGHSQAFNTPAVDSAFHTLDSYKTKHRFDSIYDLYVEFTAIPVKNLYDTICEGQTYRFDIHRGNETIVRHLATAGIYRDTVTAKNECDSINVLHLYVRNRVVTTPKKVMITDREIPYVWRHSWKDENGATQDSTEYLRESGLYTFLMPNQFGCDSIDSLVLTIHQTHLFRDTIEICTKPNLTLQHSWSTGYQQDFTTPAASEDKHYYDTLPTLIALDSIYDLFVHFKAVTSTVINESICEGESHRFGLTKSGQDRFLTQIGVYHDTLVNADGCDSIVTLHLNVYPKYTHRSYVDIADVDTPYVWYHVQGTDTVDAQNLYGSGDYVYTFTSQLGCDSIDSLTLNVHTTYDITNDTIHLCADQTPYTWNGLTNITESGSYTWYGQTAEGYDSTCTVYIHVWPLPVSFRNENICEGESFRFGLTRNGTPRFLTESGTYTDTLPSAHGCDSISTLYLHVHPKYTHHSYVDIADVDTPYVWYHVQGTDTVDAQNLYGSGDYVYTFTSKLGCDSIDSLTLKVHTSYDITNDTIHLCADQTPYTWNGITNITESGQYTWYGQTAEGYDSICHVYIHVWPLAASFRNEDICEGESFRFGLTRNGTPRFLTEGGTYYDTLRTTHGCDSIVTLYLHVHPKYTHHSYVDIADVDTPYVWYHVQGTDTLDAQNLYGSGDYVYTFTSKLGCDSIDSLTLKVHTSYDITNDTIHLCADQTPYTWNGITNITESGQYTWYGQTAEGYDSTCTVYIHVWPLAASFRNEDICEGESLRFGLTRNGTPRFLTEGGTYYDTLRTTHGCDSIVTLYLHVHPKYTHHSYVDIADVDTPYVWYHVQGTDTLDAQNLYGSGDYVYTFTSQLGCDSIDSLTLNIHATYNVTNDTIHICASETPYTWNGVTNITESGDYTWYGQTTDGYDSICNVYIKIWPQAASFRNEDICEGESFRFGLTRNGTPRFLTEGGTYYDTLRTTHGCDSIVTLYLQVYPKHTHHSYVDIADIDTPYVWYHVQDGDTLSSENLYGSGDYVYTFTSSLGCDSIDSLTLNIHATYSVTNDTIHLCASETPYTWNGVTNITESGDYTWYGQTTDGYDSICNVYIKIWPQAASFRNEDICEGETFRFGLTKSGKERFLTQSGTYYDTLRTVHGCDSIITLYLNVYPKHTHHSYVDIADADAPYVWYHIQGADTLGSENLYGSGDYVYTFTSKLGCDSIDSLTLNVHTTYDFTNDTIRICSNETPFTWNGITNIAESGLYTWYGKTVEGYDSICRVYVDVMPTLYNTMNVSLCEGNTFVYKNKPYSTSGTFYDTIPAPSGCDSIIKIVISVHPTYDHIHTEHISDKQSYWFHDRELTLTGNYEWTGKTVNTECDSLEHLILIVHPSYFFSDTIDMCNPDTLDWHGRQITKSGTYTDSLLTETYGFDSIYQVVVKVHPSYFNLEQYEIVEGNTMLIHGMNISKPGIYYDTLTTIHGCDSIFQIVVNPKRVIELYMTAAICQGEYYEFYGRNLTHTGNYTYTSQARDSIVYLNLTVNPTSTTEKRVVITDLQLPYIYDGQLYQSAGIYTDTFSNQYHCDSIVRLILVTTTHYSAWDPIPLCPGSEVKIDGQIITEAGLYSFVRRSKVTGEMDSLYRVEVYDAPAYDLPTEHRTICDGDTVFFGGRAITRAGHYDINLKTVEGCDSLLHLDLTVNPSYHFITDATIADYETYVWMGRTYTQSGIYDRSWPTIKDCDSTYTLRLRVMETERYLTEDTICEGQTYVWRGKKYETDGYYTDTIYQPATFYSAIYTLQLTTLRPTTITSAKVGEVCADGESFDIEFTYTGAKPAAYSIYFDQLAKDEGFEDVINRPFMGEDRIARAEVPVKKDVIYLEHTTYVKPNRYSMRMVLDNGACGKSRSDSLMLLVKYPSWIIEQNWGDVVAPLKKELNGGYEFTQTEWYVNGTLQPNNGLGYLHNDKLKEGDEVYMLATRKGESYAIPTCPIIIVRPKDNEHENPILVYPTQAPRRAPHVTVEAPIGGQYAVYSSTGLLLQEGELDEGKMQLTLPSINGIYFIRTTVDSQTETHKVILY